MNGEHHDAKAKLDWRTIGMTFAMVAGQGLVQYGVIVTKTNDLERRMERVEQKLDERFLTREEFEKRHQELERRLEDLRQQVQSIESERISELQKKANR